MWLDSAVSDGEAPVVDLLLCKLEFRRIKNHPCIGASCQEFTTGVVTCRSRVSKVVFEATVNGKPITVFHVGKFETINMALI